STCCSKVCIASCTWMAIRAAWPAAMSMHCACRSGSPGIDAPSGDSRGASALPICWMPWPSAASVAAWRAACADPEVLTQLAAFYRRYGHQLPLAFKAIVKMRCHVAVYRGKLRGRDETMTLLYAGRQRSLAWLLRSTFDEWQELHPTACTVFTNAAPRRRLGTQADVEILDFGWPYDVAVRRSGRH